MPVIHVIGASGGLGTSTFAAALAARAARRHLRTVLADGDPTGALDVTCGIEHAEGYRWSDLADLEGEADGRLVLGGLPHDECPVLSGDVSGARVTAPVRDGVLGALSGASGVLVVDAGRPRGTAGTPGLAVLVAGVSPRRLADADRAVLAWPPGDPLPVLVTRGPRRDEDLAEVVAVHLGLPLGVHLPDLPRFPVDEAAGRWPGTRGVLARAADRVLDVLVDPAVTAVAS